MKWFNSLDTKYKVLIVIAILIILYVLHRYIAPKIKKATQKQDTVFIPGETSDLSPQQQSSIKLIGLHIFNDIQDTSVTGHTYKPYQDALLLTDNELHFLAQYYKRYLSSSSETLHDDIDSQVYVFGGEPAKLIARLAAIGEE